MKLLMRDEAKGREHTIFVTIFSALMVMLAIVVMLMASATAISGVTLQLDENAVDILDKQVENRAGYIQDQLQQAQELTDLSTYINETTQQMLDDETLSLKTLDSSSSDSLQTAGRELGIPDEIRRMRDDEWLDLPHPEYPRLHGPHLRRPPALRLPARPRPGCSPLCGKLGYFA